MAAAAAAAASSSCFSSSDSLLLRKLIARGWHFRDMDRIQGLITSQLAMRGSRCTVDSIESELLNIDLRSFGGKCLPEPSLLRKTSQLQGPIVLQICSCRDISRSQINNASENLGNRRLLQLKLTDGLSIITAVEYSPVPSIPEDVIPGSKVRLQDKADVCSGILCLRENVITVLGGVVESLYEEWKLKRKCLDVPRPSLKFSEGTVSSGPPPFEKLRAGAPAQQTVHVLYAYPSKGAHSSSDASEFSGCSSNDYRESLAEKCESLNLNPTVKLQKNVASMDGETDDVKFHTADKKKGTCSSTRLKVTASVPVQNQVAAQKLLQRTSQLDFSNPNPRSQRLRGKFKEEGLPLITLDEWERMKAGNDLATHEHSDICQDEDLARQLQEQFNWEDIQAQKDSHAMEAKNIKMSMFNFERDVGVGRTRGKGKRRGKGC